MGILNLRGLLPLLLCAGATDCHSTSVDASPAARESKIDFERRTGALVWDVGAVPGQIDAGDDFTDMAKPCAVEHDSPQTQVRELSSRHLDTAGLDSSTSRILGRLGLDTADDRVNPVIAVEGRSNSPTFLLFPEIHLKGGDRAVLRLHEARATDMWRMAEKMLGRFTMVNTDEGPQGEWPQTVNQRVLDPAARVTFASGLMADKWETGAQLLSELFFGQITSREHDSNDLAIKYVLSLYALDETVDWDRARARVLERLPTRASRVDLESYRGFHEALARMGAPQIESLNTDLCERRSREMARYTATLAGSARAGVAFMSFGALHAHGVLEEIRSLGASAVVFSPNYAATK